MFFLCFGSTSFEATLVKTLGRPKVIGTMTERPDARAHLMACPGLEAWKLVGIAVNLMDVNDL